MYSEKQAARSQAGYRAARGKEPEKPGIRRMACSVRKALSAAPHLICSLAIRFQNRFRIMLSQNSCKGKNLILNCYTDRIREMYQYKSRESGHHRPSAPGFIRVIRQYRGNSEKENQSYSIGLDCSPCGGVTYTIPLSSLCTVYAHNCLDIYPK